MKVHLHELKSPYYFDQTFSFANNDLGIDFKRSGKFYVAICPVHSGKKPSLYLHHARETVRFTCFSDKCNGSWDVFALIQELERCDFITAVKRLKLQTNQWKKWADKELTEKSYAKAMKAMKVGKKATEIIEDRISQDASGFTDNRFPIMSIWIFYNVLTWYITHHAVSLNHRVEMERRLRSAMRHFRGTRP